MKLIAQVLAYEEGNCISRAIEPWAEVCTQIDVFEGAFQTLCNLGYPLHSQDETIANLINLQGFYPNVHVYHHMAVNEPVLRNAHLWQTITKFGDDAFLFILDADEIYTKDEVKKCIEQVEAEKDQFNTWWVNFKNYVGDEKTYHLGFRVPRFFKLDQARGFSGYNDICFEDGVKATDIRDVLPRHLSWTPIEKARRKLEWQNAIGWETSWKLEKNKIVINEPYYIHTGKIKPTLQNDPI